MSADHEVPARQLFDRTVVALLCLAALTRFAVVVTSRHIQLTNDPADYQRLAVSIAHGHGFGPSVVAAGGGASAFRAPLYPTLLGAFYAVTGVHLTLARLVQAVGGVVAVALLYLLAHRLFGRRVAVVACALAAVYPPLVMASTSILSEVAFIPLEIAALLAATYARRAAVPGRTLRWAVAAGVLAGLVCLARSAGLVLIPVVALLVWTPRGARDASLTRWGWQALATPAVAVLAAALTLAPWTIRNAVALHRFVPVTTADAFTLAGSYNDQARTDPHTPASFRPFSVIPEYAHLYTDRKLKEADVYDKLRDGAVKYMREHPGYVAVVVGHNLVRLAELDGFHYSRAANASIGTGRRLSDAAVLSFWIAALFAIVGVFTRRRRNAPVAFWLAPLLLLAITAVAVGTTRYRMPIEPFTVLLASLGAVAVYERVRGRHSVPPASPDA
jgi:dolichyl-phosphate-mannose-protein mannosyltransferase